MTNLDDCPNCKMSLVGDPIPDQSLPLYGGSTHYRKEVGVEIRGVYDGVLYWSCPGCGWAWHRWDDSNPEKVAKARPYIEEARRTATSTNRWDVV
jgi:hypothetical protein